MIDVRRIWREFWRTPPGRRFATRHERMRGQGRTPWGRALRSLLGAVLIVLGLIFMPLPGPGFVPLLFGAVVLAGESARVAQWLDRAELRVRGWLRR